MGFLGGYLGLLYGIIIGLISILTNSVPPDPASRVYSRV